jgi:NADH-quinone oxidoreductase subunit N
MENPMAADLFYGLLPEHLLLALLVVLMLIEIIGRGERAAGLLFVLATGAGCGVLLAQLGQNYSVSVVAGEIAVDRFSLLGRLAVLACSVVYGFTCLGNDNRPKFWMLLNASLLGACVVLDSSGFISLFLGIELLSLPAFALMVHRASETDATEGAFKYLLLSAVASAMILFGISLAYGSVGTLNILDFTSSLAVGGRLKLAATILVLCGFFLKAAVFPLHGWAPDAYSGARLQTTAFLASIVKAAVVLGLVRVFGNAPLGEVLTVVVVILGVASILYGNITAIRQANFKRLLAYSSIAHAGYMIFALSENTGGRTEALFYYVAVYALTTIVACSCFAMLTQCDEDDLDALDGAFAKRPLPALLLAACLLSLAGIPPLPGFLAKFFIFKTVIASGQTAAAVLAFTGSFIGVTYYLGIVGRLFKKVEQTSAAERRAPFWWSMGGVILGSLILAYCAVLPNALFF